MKPTYGVQRGTPADKPLMRARSNFAMPRAMASAMGVLLAGIPSGAAFYLPGVAPREYGPGERVELKVGRRPRRAASQRP